MQKTYIIPRPLPSHWQPQSMPPPAIRARLSHALDILQDLPAQVVLDLHVRQRGGQVEDLLVGQLADFAGGVDVEASEQARRGVRAYAEKVFQRFL